MTDVVSLEARLDRLERSLDEQASDLRLVRSYLADPHATLNKVRYITEGVLHRLCKQHGISWGKAEPTLENMFGPLVAGGVVPKNIGIHLRTIQTNASPGSHFQETPLTASHVNIALLALVDVLEWLLDEREPQLPAAAPRRAPRIVHPLQPARNFAGRAQLLERLQTWWTDPAPTDRVVSLVALGGAGKTALAERVLATPAPGGVFAWSFYEDQRTESLLAEALAYFGLRDVEVGARLERLRAFLGDSLESHTFVFDGIEAIQSSGGGGKLRGRIEDASIRLLLRSLAAGLGRTRALITSRARLVDLDDWQGRGYRAIAIDDLDREATRAVLRGWGVRGDDARLDRLHAAVGGHALSVAVLGSYLATCCEGDPDRASSLLLATVAEEDPLAARLARLLDRYTEALPADERDLVVQLAIFPRGTDLELLGFLTRDPAVAGSLAGASPQQLVAALERLVRKGLAYASRSPRGEVYSAHPFIRAHLKRLLGVPPEQLHEVVRAGVAPTLGGAPRSVIRDPELLDRYELLIEHTRLANQGSRALQLFRRTLGGYANLGTALGENARGWRIATGLLADPSVGTTADDAPEDRAALYSETAQFAQSIGDADEARRLFEQALAWCRPRRESTVFDLTRRMLAELELVSARLERAIEIVKHELEVDSRSGVMLSLAGVLFQLAGMPDEAARWLAEGDRPKAGDPSATPFALSARPGVRVYRASYLLSAGDTARARALFAEALAAATRDELQLEAARARLGLGAVALAEATGGGSEELASVRAWALGSGHVETLVRCHHLAGGLALARDDRATAEHEIAQGLQLAESAGFALLAIDLQILGARASRDRELARAALHRATEAGYLWAAVDAGWQLGDHEAARALAVRIRHPLAG